MKTIERILDILTKMEYTNSCRYLEEDNNLCFALYLPDEAEEWFEIYIGDQDNWSAIQNHIENFIDDYDVDYETYKWLGPDGHGKNGAPYHIQSLLDHYVKIKQYLEDIFMTLNYKMEEV